MLRRWLGSWWHRSSLWCILNFSGGLGGSCWRSVIGAGGYLASWSGSALVAHGGRHIHLASLLRLGNLLLCLIPSVLEATATSPRVNLLHRLLFLRFVLGWLRSVLLLHHHLLFSFLLGFSLLFFFSLFLFYLSITIRVEAAINPVENIVNEEELSLSHSLNARFLLGQLHRPVIAFLIHVDRADKPGANYRYR